MGRGRNRAVAVLAAAAVAIPAASQTLLAQPRSRSAEGFSECREQEKVGDARACWVVWLKKFRAIGSEAEVAYAEEHANRAPDPQKQEPTPSASSSSAPPEPAPATSAASPAPAPSQQPTEPASKSATAAMGYAKGDVLDLCALAPQESKGKFVKQRVVVFAPTDAAQINDDPAVRAAGGATLLRDVFTARFPLQRFHNVVTELAGRKGWAQRDTLPVGDIEEYLRSKFDEGDPARTERIDHERPFVAYSVACADYIAVPAIVSHETKWEEQEVQTKQGKKKVRSLSLALVGTLTIFKRDGNTFRRMVTLAASVPSFIDRANDVAVASVPDVKIAGVSVVSAVMKTPDLPSYISAVPSPACLLGKSPKDGLGALSECGRTGEGTAEQALGALDERLGAVCLEARSTGDPALMVKCEVRARAFQLSRSLQKESRSVDGWKLFALLANRDGNHTFSLGADEGMKVGYGFEVIGADGSRVAYFKTTEIGVGGEGGEASPSRLALRSGEAPPGSRLDEYPQIGLVFAPLGAFGVLTYDYKQTDVGGAVRGGVAYTLPSVVFGGGITFGYDLSPHLGWTETYLRLGAGFFAGFGTNTTATLIPIDVWFEKGIYLGPVMTLVGAIGPTLQFASVKLAASPRLQQDTNLSATVYGPAARAGLDFLLHPDWTLRVDLTLRVPLNSASYSAGSGQTVPAEWDRREDHFATMMAGLGLAKTF